jgi:ADP-heptose:LPS heptosyltransferase
MVTARVRMLHARNPVPVLIQGVDGQPRWSEVWEHNPRIARTAEEAGQILRDGPGARPYLDYARLTKKKFYFRQQSLEPGEIYLTEVERSFGRPIVLIEPHVKQGASANKDWGFERFQSVVRARPDLPWVQCDYGARILEAVEPIKTGTFREACAVMSGALAAVLPEGGLHHAAAAFRVKAVVIFGAYIPPSVTGYPDHINLARSVPEVEGLGQLDSRAQAALASITVAEVVEKLAEVLSEISPGQGPK